MELLRVFVSVLYLGLVFSECPDQQLFKPCVCSTTPQPLNGIYCGGTQDIDLEEIFGRLQIKLNGTQKSFGLFVLNNTVITELKENTFKDITFKDIRINNCYNLTKIHENAFIQTELVTKTVVISGNSKLDNQNNSLIKVLTKFVNVEEMFLGYNNLMEIPSDAFKPTVGYQDKLTQLQIVGHSVKYIGSRSFYSLRNLQMLTISNTSIETIPDFAFEFELSSDVSIEINLSKNNLIKASSLNKYSLMKIGRPVTIFGLTDDSFNYLNQTLFESYLKDSRHNLSDVRLNCSDCRNYWLFNGTKLSINVNGQCLSGYKLNDTRNFETCKKKPTDESPCEYRKHVDTVFCGGDHDFDIKAYFQNLSDSLPSDKKQIYSLELNNKGISSLEDYTFNDITFKYISIGNCLNLSFIHENAFSRTSLTAIDITIEKNPKLSEKSSPIFKILSKFVNAEMITLRQNAITEIPARAFEPINGQQVKLEQLDFFLEPITKIGQFAFSSLPNLRYLTFSQAQFSSLPENAFAYEKSANHSLRIDLSGNPSLFKSSVITDKTFLNTKRPTELFLGQPCCPNEINYLDQQIFLPFLLENPENIIDLDYENFLCTDCRNSWIKKHNLLSRLQRTKCSNGKTLTDPDNFKNCSFV